MLFQVPQRREIQSGRGSLSNRSVNTRAYQMLKRRAAVEIHGGRIFKRSHCRYCGSRLFLFASPGARWGNVALILIAPATKNNSASAQKRFSRRWMLQIGKDEAVDVWSQSGGASGVTSQPAFQPTIHLIGVDTKKIYLPSGNRNRASTGG